MEQTKTFLKEEIFQSQALAKKDFSNAEYIYIHVPFCEHKCSYCDFNVFIGLSHWAEKYFDALETEILLSFEKEEREALEKGLPLKQIKTIYFGGGTPSFVETRHLRRILNVISQKRSLAPDVEITIEVNPEQNLEEKLKDYKEMGIQRLSMGLQVVDDLLLKEIGRFHTVEDAKQNLLAARTLGFQNISIDLMFALPRQKTKHLQNALQFVSDFQPEHIAMYSLILEEHTHYWLRFGPEGKEKHLLPSEEEEREQYYFLRDGLKKLGYEQYEISNFSKKGKQSLHNRAYWRNQSYHGFGAGASRYLKGVRSESLRSLRKYTEHFLRLREEKFSLQERETQLALAQPLAKNLTEVELQDEFFLLRFRCFPAFSFEHFEKSFGKRMSLHHLLRLQEHVRKGNVFFEEDLCSLSIQGQDYANLVFGSFVEKNK